MTRILCIGCGYLGGRIAERAADRGDDVFVTTRRPEAAEGFRARGWSPIVCDVLAAESLDRLPAVDVVVHAVARDRRSAASMADVYVRGLANVLDRLPSVQRFVYVSSSSVYGQRDGEWIDETSPTEPEEPAGQVVLEAESLLRARLPSAIVLRFSGIYGPGRLLRRTSIETGEPIVGDAEKWLNLIHVADGASAVLAAIDRGGPGSIVNVCDDEPVRRRDFYTTMARLLAAPEPRFDAPPPDAPTPPHERGNRRIRNRRMHELGVSLQFPSYRIGLADSVAGNQGPKPRDERA
jgi:nucleoside-diphosphate-sugar epimerase